MGVTSPHTRYVHTPPTPFYTISYTAYTLLCHFILYLNSSLLATFYTLSFIDYIHEATHSSTHPASATHPTHHIEYSPTTFYTLSFIDYIHEATHLLTLLTLLTLHTLHTLPTYINLLNLQYIYIYITIYYH